MSDTKYLIWNRDTRDDVWALESADFMDEIMMIDYGDSYADEWPEVAEVPVDPDWLDNARLADHLPGSECYVISKKLKGFLDQAGVEQVEYLPLSVMGKEGQVLSSEYFGMNPLGVVDCLDTDASEVTWNTIDTSLITTCKRLVLKSDVLDPAVKIFRPDHLGHMVLIDADLAKKLVEAGFTHLSFFDPAEYNGVGFSSGRPVYQTLDRQ